MVLHFRRIPFSFTPLYLRMNSPDCVNVKINAKCKNAKYKNHQHRPRRHRH